VGYSNPIEEKGGNNMKDRPPRGSDTLMVTSYRTRAGKPGKIKRAQGPKLHQLAEVRGRGGCTRK